MHIKTLSFKINLVAKCDPVNIDLVYLINMKNNVSFDMIKDPIYIKRSDP